MVFWRSVLRKQHPNLKLVFVSKYFAEEVMEDIGFRLPEEGYEIIHNPIDTNIFQYHKKTAAHRKNVLLIRPFASKKYANDLAVKAILLLSAKPWFNDMRFKLIGDGMLMEETVHPVRHLGNVEVHQKFLTHEEISELHQQNGIFLVPTRMDAQGVSRDEAMASGLVPVTTAVAAVPEFVDETSGILVPPEDAKALADAIERLYHDPELFLRLSEAAAKRVRTQSDAALIIAREVAVLQPATGADASAGTQVQE